MGRRRNLFGVLVRKSRKCTGWVVLLAMIGSAVPAMAQDGQVQDTAINAAFATFERALPDLATTEFGVDVGAYRAALGLQRFQSVKWGGSVSVEIRRQAEASGGCARFVAFVRVPPQDGVVPLVLCPKFFTEGTDELRALTILHEMVHVVAGPDECQAMAFAARVQQAATGTFTPVDAYWRASNCVKSAYRLPD